MPNDIAMDAHSRAARTIARGPRPRRSNLGYNYDVAVRRLLLVLLAAAMGCDRSPPRDIAKSDAAPPESGEDRSLESNGCEYTYGYREPVFKGPNGFVALPHSEEKQPGAVAIESLIGGRILGLLIDVSGSVFTFIQGERGKLRVRLTGTVDKQTWTAMHSSVRAMAAAPMRTFTPPDCGVPSWPKEIRLYGTDSLESPTILASARSGSVQRRTSREADRLIRWVFTVHRQALGVPPTCEANDSRTDCQR